ncbi:D-alanine-D-alanine ligase [Salsuginibacillus halophilus]|uniref:D-alanine--D-alanine ligase n=1 Tax=Salsuginibacillus halophilus TaxID=517424 RepID=A0A2P8H3N3_9BACI|nr:D-alanine--D-alanine ligase family protein [Salsuginibacillus halophilus]PSL40828.1 D-alanine-D-alanine ligase [Salsuginibacillus halophilus]
MKTRVGVFFGGVSVEHEVSVISALQAMQAMDQQRYEPVPVYIAKDRTWYTGDVLFNIENFKDLKQLLQDAQKITAAKGEEGAVLLQKDPQPKFGKKTAAEIDFALPVVHGTFGEDGVLQGMFELYDLPYAGCDVTASAAGMDKVKMKQVLRDQKVPVLPEVWLYTSDWAENREGWLEQMESIAGYPAIVKPANLGSSVGIGTASNRAELEDAVEEAFQFTTKVIVEPMIQNMREVNCSVLGDYESAAPSVIEEVLKTEEILSYQDKYQGGGGAKDGGSADPQKGGSSGGMENTDRIIPAEIAEEKRETVEDLAVRTFKALGCNGVSRVDIMMDEDTGQVYVNEINTIPGSLSFYLWEPAGKDFTQLTHELIQLGLKRKRERERLTFSIDSNLFAMQGGGAKGSKNGSKS